MLKAVLEYIMGFTDHIYNEKILLVFCAGKRAFLLWLKMLVSQLNMVSCD